MPNIITPEAFRNETEMPTASAMWDAIWNLYSTYQAVWGQPPKYLYLHTRVWEDVVGPHMLGDITGLGLEVVYDNDLVPNRVDLHHYYIAPKDLAKWQRSFTDEEGEETGKLSIE